MVSDPHHELAKNNTNIPYKTIDSDNSMNDKVEIIILGRMGSGNHDRENATYDTLYCFGGLLLNPPTQVPEFAKLQGARSAS